MILLARQPCLLCTATHSGQSALCHDCQRAVPTLRNSCPRCAEPQFSNDLCKRCQDQTPPIESVIAAGLYQQPITQLVQRFKFGRDLVAGRALAELIEQQAFTSQRADILIPMPLHWRRCWQRSFNQAAELAAQIGKDMSIDVAYNLVRRTKPTRSQSTLTAAQRRRNLRGAFELHESATSRLANKHIVVIDDVMTTGSSIYAVAELLKTAQPASIRAWVAARAGQQN